jgi:hypothetical protein
MAEMFGKQTMNCEGVEAIVLDLDREDALNSAEMAAAVAHVSHCPRCAALQESWQAAKEELRLLGEETLEARAPARVEMRLRQEFRTKHHSADMRRGGLVAAWVLATAALVLGVVSYNNWQASRRLDAEQQKAAAQNALLANAQNNASSNVSAGISSGDESGDFTPLPGTTLDESEEASIYHVRMQRGSLGVLGLPVNEQRAGEWIQVDLLVGNDGLPQGVRLAEEQD